MATSRATATRCPAGEPMPRPTASGTACTSAPVARLNAGGRRPAARTRAASAAVSPGATPALARMRSTRGEAATREKSQPPAAMPVILVQPAAGRRVIRCITPAGLCIIKPRRRKDFLWTPTAATSSKSQMPARASCGRRRRSTPCPPRLGAGAGSGGRRPCRGLFCGAPAAGSRAPVAPASGVGQQLVGLFAVSPGRGEPAGRVATGHLHEPGHELFGLGLLDPDMAQLRSRVTRRRRSPDWPRTWPASGLPDRDIADAGRGCPPPAACAPRPRGGNRCRASSGSSRCATFPWTRPGRT